jgi:hypothetical protein
VHEQEHIGDIPRWLEEETEGLDPEAKERVYRDMEAHMTDAVSKQLANAPASVRGRNEIYDFLSRMAAELRSNAQEQLQRAEDRPWKD